MLTEPLPTITDGRSLEQCGAWIAAWIVQRDRFLEMATSGTKRTWYRRWKCDFGDAEPISLAINGARGGPIHPMFHDIWFAFSRVLEASGRNTFSAWAYVCRNATGSLLPSLHSYVGLARDENPAEGPFRRTPSLRKVRFSDKARQEDRAYDVKDGIADTSYREVEVERLLQIRFRCDHDTPAFRWGGHFRTVKDAMHWEVDHPPECVRLGVDWSTVYGNGETPGDEDMLRKGDHSDDVKVLQTRLNHAGYSAPDGSALIVDGRYGDNSAFAVGQAQADRGYTINPDACRDALLADLKPEPVGGTFPTSGTIRTDGAPFTIMWGPDDPDFTNV